MNAFSRNVIVNITLIVVNGIYLSITFVLLLATDVKLQQNSAEYIGRMKQQSQACKANSRARQLCLLFISISHINIFSETTIRSPYWKVSAATHRDTVSTCMY